jgi:hypothetical protein
MESGRGAAAKARLSLKLADFSKPPPGGLFRFQP